MRAGHRNLGIGFTPLERRPDVIVEIGCLAEELGYRYVAVGEGWGFDATHLLGEIGRRTDRIRLMTGVLSVWGRSPATIAMTAATLHHLTGGRFVLGLGVGTPALTEGLHDTAFRRPVDRLRTSLLQVRALLAGERVPLEAGDGVRPLRLAIEPAPGVPLVVGAMSPGTRRVVAELADGWLPYLVPPDRLAPQAEQMAGARDPALPPLEVMPAVFACASTDPGAARRAIASTFVLYVTVMGDLYPRLIRTQGYGEQLDRVLEANRRSSDGVVPPEAEDLLRLHHAYGTPDEAVEGVSRWFEAGAHSVGIVIPPGLPRELIEETVRALAPSA